MKSLVKGLHRQTENQTINLEIKLKSMTECHEYIEISINNWI